MTDFEKNIDNSQQQTFEKAQPSVRVGITQGDINGIGFEIILKTFADSAMLDLCIPIIFGHINVANFQRKALGINVPLKIISSAEDAKPGQVNFVSCSDADLKVEFGVQSQEVGHAAFEALELAVQEYKMGNIDALVTAPINKASIQSTNFRFVGHTEYLQNCFDATNSNALMILCNNVMRVALVTTHLPISEIAFAITQEKVEQKARLLYKSLCQDFNISCPRIAVLALNPHSGDQGVIGHEEVEVIDPAVKVLNEEGVPCYGPFAADGFFGAGLYKHFDGILAMYHDQGLAPFKALSMNDGVNFTAGLPIIRTSPDHGTAYDIAGKGIADAGSFRQAIYTAIDIYRNRSVYVESHENPLPKLYQDRKER